VLKEGSKHSIVITPITIERQLYQDIKTYFPEQSTPLVNNWIFHNPMKIEFIFAANTSRQILEDRPVKAIVCAKYGPPEGASDKANRKTVSEEK